MSDEEETLTEEEPAEEAPVEAPVDDSPAAPEAPSGTACFDPAAGWEQLKDYALRMRGVPCGSGDMGLTLLEFIGKVESGHPV